MAAPVVVSLDEAPGRRNQAVPGRRIWVTLAVLVLVQRWRRIEAAAAVAVLAVLAVTLPRVRVALVAPV
jgi:hypothetical protein